MAFLSIIILLLYNIMAAAFAIIDSIHFSIQHIFSLLKKIVVSRVLVTFHPESDTKHSISSMSDQSFQEVHDEIVLRVPVLH